MKKIIELLILIMVLALAGCGKSQDVVQDASYEAQDDSSMEDSSEEEDGLDEEMDDALTDEGAEDSAGDDVREEKGEAKGIIVAIYNIIENGGRSYDETILAINPDDGQVQCIAEFSYKSWNYEVTGLDRYGGAAGTDAICGYANYRNAYSSDYKKRAVAKVIRENNSLHAGWIDTDGNFFDVSEEVGDVPDSDFADPPQHRAYGFAWDGKFVYEVKYGTYHVVDPENVSKGAYTEKNTEHWDEHAYLNIPDSVLSDLNPGAKLEPTDWLDNSRCIADKDTFHSVIYNTKTKKISKYIPGESHYSWNGVASPDGKKIAFLSTAGEENNIDIYITSPKGGEPEKLEAEFIDDWKLRMNLSGSQTSYCKLLDWK